MPDLVQATPEEVPRVWPALRERIAFGIEKSDRRMTVEGLYERAVSGEWDLHIVLADDGDAIDRIRCVFFTQIYREMNGDVVCAMRFLSGKGRADWTWLVEALELWALQNGCTRMEILARRGWARELKDYEYRPTHVLLEKTLKAKSHGKLGQAPDRNEHAHPA